MPKAIVEGLINLARQLPEFSQKIKGLSSDFINPQESVSPGFENIINQYSESQNQPASSDYSSQQSQPIDEILNNASPTPNQSQMSLQQMGQLADSSLPQARSVAQDTTITPPVSSTTSLPKARMTAKQPSQAPVSPAVQQSAATGSVQPPTSTEPNIRDIEGQAHNTEFINRLGKASELLGTAIAGHGAKPTAQGIFDSNIKAAEDEVQKELTLQKNDPTSEYSKKLQQIVKDKFGTDTTGLSAEQLKDTALKPIVEAFEKKEARDLQDKLLKEKLAERNFEATQGALNRKALQSEKTSNKKDETDTKRLDTLNTKLTGAIASSRSAFGQAARNAQSVQNAEALLNGENMDYDALDNRQIYELAKTLDGVLAKGNGGSSVSGTEHLVPDNARSKLAKMLEFMSGERQSAGQGSFVQKYADTLSREKQIAVKQMSDTQGEVLGGMADLKDHPRMQDILTAHNLPSDFFNNLSKKTSERKQSGKETAKTPQKEKPTTVTQNGHVYHLNPQTGEYE